MDAQEEGIPINRTELVHSGPDYFSRLLTIIANAQTEFHLQTYIFENDTTGIEIAEALKKAASRNVKVYVLLDAYGSFSLPKNFVNDLVNHGINFRFFSTFFSANNFYIGRRLHHKVALADNSIALIGGINIANKYRGSATVQPWLDYAVEIENVSIVTSLQLLCRNIFFKRKGNHVEKMKRGFRLNKENTTIILRNDWLKRKNEIKKAYINSIRNAKSEVIIVGSYFLPGRKLTRVLKKASASGVKIKIILSGISDVPLVRHASYYLYSSFLKHNIELYEWKKSVLHGKVALVDNKWATVGSFNLNHLSSYASIEMNVEINSPDFSESLSSHLNHIIHQSEKITNSVHLSRNGIFEKILNWFAFRLIRIIMIMVTYLPYKRYLKKHQSE